MPSTNLSLTLQQADTVLSRWLKCDVVCERIEALKGGMINTALRLTFEQSPFTAVIKLNTDPDSSGLQSEYMRLDYLKTHTRLPVPTAYHYAPADQAMPYSYLLLETIPGTNMAQVDLAPKDRSAIERELAETLIDLHRHTRTTYGRIHEPGVASWAEIFVPELQAMRDNVEGKLTDAVLGDIDAALTHAAEILTDQGPPTLIHEDLWAGNIMVDRGEEGWHLAGLVDPSGAKFADVECELAYLQIFDTVGSTFFDVYTASHPLRPGYELRRLFYWLNTHMIHVWLFGDRSYMDRTAEVARKIRSYTTESN